MNSVVVLGGGIAGCSVALALRRRRLPVVLADAGTRTGGIGGSATGAAAGMLAVQYEASSRDFMRSFAIRAGARHVGFLEEIERLSGMRVHRRVGGVLVANFDASEARAARATIEWQGEAGLSAVLLDPAEARARQSGLAPGAESWLWLPEEVSVDAQLLPAVLRAACGAAGVELRSGSRAVALETARGGVRGVRFSEGAPVEADRVVVALGAWSGTLLGLPSDLPIRPVAGQMLRIRVPESASLGPVLADHGGRYVVPRADGTVLAGSTMDERGFEAETTSEARSGLRLSAERLWPDLAGAELVDHWAGLRPVSADGLPVLGPDPDLEGLFYATGYGRSGILLAPWAGELVADSVAGGGTTFDTNAFGAGRFRRSRKEIAPAG